MRINRIEVVNFRNFQYLELRLGLHAVIVGENNVGKSNLVYALRLILDPRMPDSDRQLRLEDFWDGLPRPLTKHDVIRITLELTDFETNEDLLAVLAEYLVQPEPMVARLTYVFRPLPTLTGDPQKDSDYEYLLYGGERPENRIGYELRQSIPLTVVQALRDAEADLSNWRYSPLAPLLREVSARIDRADLVTAVEEISIATASVANLPEIRDLASRIADRITKMVGPHHAVDTTLRFSPADPDRILRTLRLFIDGGARGISDSSLGLANLIYLSLLSLDLDRQIGNGKRGHNFLVIEEPEAHLHPHLQRLAFRDFLRTRFQASESDEPRLSETILVTTHSPHIVSVAPLNSLVSLRKLKASQSTTGVSTANLTFEQAVTEDLERYLDVKRGEIVFAKGILLVEGPAEEFVLPVLGRLLGYDFDQMGITVCSVDGTNFTPYVRLLGSSGLDIPFAVVTDMDPNSRGKPALGEDRVLELLPHVVDKEKLRALDRSAQLKLARKRGLFLNQYTFEVDLFRCGRHVSICKTICELTTNGAAKKRAQEWKDHPATLEPERLLADIEAIGKGRFAQRLASHLKNKKCPSYISRAIRYVAKRVSV